MSVYSDTEGSSEDIEVVGEAQQGLQPSHMEDDAPKGTVLPQALVDRIVDIFVTRRLRQACGNTIGSTRVETQCYK